MPQSYVHLRNVASNSIKKMLKSDDDRDSTFKTGQEKGGAEEEWEGGKREYPLTIRCQLVLSVKGSRDSLLVERRTRDGKVASSNPGRSGGRIFLFKSQLSVQTLIRCPFHPRVTAVARKRPRSFYQQCRWQVTPKT